MTLLLSILALVGGVICVIFNKPLAISAMKYYPEEKRPRMFTVNRIVNVLIGFWLIIGGLWVTYRQYKR